MTVYTLKEAEGELTTVLEKAALEGEVCIKGETGERFVLKPDQRRSPLDVEGVDLDLTREEIVSIVREARER